MATIFVTVECIVEYLLTLLAHRIRALLECAGKRFNRVCGGLFMTIGVALPMTKWGPAAIGTQTRHGLSPKAHNPSANGNACKHCQTRACRQASVD